MRRTILKETGRACPIRKEMHMSEQDRKQQGGLGDLHADLLIELGLERVRTIGIVLLLLGVAALISPAVAGTLVSLVIGVLLLAAGLSKGIRILWTRSWKKQWEDVLLGILAVVGGALIIARPLVGLSAITLSLVVYFGVSGLLQIAWWWRLPRALSSPVMLLAGLVTLLLAVLIGTEWPLSGFWAVGTLVGVHLLFGGTSLIALASPPRTKKPTDEAGA
jgi:uncharacterized membrane protein HdeD (DUF308 family)